MIPNSIHKCKHFFVLICLFSSIPTISFAQDIYIVGSGSVGTFFSTVLSKENKVTVISLTGKTEGKVKIPTKTQESIKTTDKEHSLPFKQWKEIEKFQPGSVIIVATNAGDIKKIEETLTHRLDGSQTLVFVQNGINILNKTPKLESYPKTVRGIVQFGINVSNQDSPELIVNSNPRVALASKNSSELISEVETLFSDVGIIITEKSNNILRTEWKKALLNIYINGLTALCDKTIGEILNSPKTSNVAKTILDEGVKIAKTEGIELSKEDISKVIELANGLKPHSTSMREHIKKGMETESTWLYGHMLEIANAHHVPIPNTKELYDLLKLKEQNKPIPNITEVCGEDFCEDTIDIHNSVNKAIEGLKPNPHCSKL
jgi:2-dehydropantoate 2-reductase